MVKCSVYRPGLRRTTLEFATRPFIGETVRTFDDGGFYIVERMHHNARLPGASKKPALVIFLGVPKDQVAWGIPSFQDKSRRRGVNVRDRNHCFTAISARTRPR